jgi:hypothetical protein
LTVAFTGVAHVTARPNEPPKGMEVHINTGDFTFVPDGSTVATATGHFAAVEVGAGGKNGVEGSLANAVGYTTDGDQGQLLRHVPRHRQRPRRHRRRLQQGGMPIADASEGEAGTVGLPRHYRNRYCSVEAPAGRVGRQNVAK